VLSPMQVTVPAYRRSQAVFKWEENVCNLLRMGVGGGAGCWS
jgi:hypothetical protein